LAIFFRAVIPNPANSTRPFSSGSSRAGDDGLDGFVGDRDGFLDGFFEGDRERDLDNLGESGDTHRPVVVFLTLSPSQGDTHFLDLFRTFPSLHPSTGQSLSVTGAFLGLAFGDAFLGALAFFGDLAFLGDADLAILYIFPEIF
jgi:hypothetical protein